MTASEIARACKGRLISGDPDFKFTSVTTDSRTTDSGTLFIPLKGERFDGHDFIKNVADSGAGGYIFSSGKCTPDGKCAAIEVNDTSDAILDIAAYYRSRFGNLTVIGLTGSVGKTTTKGMIASVLSEKYKTHSTEKNYNNNIGVPLTLFGLKSDDEAAVVEMGMSGFGEIKVLSECARPDIAVITNIGTCHIEFLGSREGILKAKCEIFDGLKKGGKVVLNGDDSYLAGLNGKTELDITYVGIKSDLCRYKAENIRLSESGADFEADGKKYHINVAGGHNIYNALTAIAVGYMMNMTYEEIRAGLESYKSEGIRQNIISYGGIKIINDCYNASPDAMKAEADVLESLAAKRRIAVLGDMAELGEMGAELHGDVGRYLNKKNIDTLVTVGSLARHIAENAKNIPSHCFDDCDGATAFLKSYLSEGDAVLIKASRCMKFERISKALCE